MHHFLVATVCVSLLISHIAASEASRGGHRVHHAHRHHLKHGTHVALLSTGSRNTKAIDKVTSRREQSNVHEIDSDDQKDDEKEDEEDKEEDAKEEEEDKKEEELKE